MPNFEAMMSNPMVQAMMSNPNFMKQAMKMDPRLQQLAQDNPELAEAISDSKFLEQVGSKSTKYHLIMHR
jgi:hypothetical protein